jgi:hypothetical protein
VNCAPTQTTYTVCGFTVRSELPLPELLAASPDSPKPEIDLDIRYGAVPETLEGADHSYYWFETRGDGEILIKVPHIGRFLLQKPGTVWIDPALPVVEQDLRAILFGSVLGAFIHMRHLMPLHASAIRFGDSVVAFTGVSGAGKSTMAAILAERGYSMVSDDVCAIDPAPGGNAPPLVRPSFARLKLWGDSMDALGKPKLDSCRDTLRWEKYHLRLQSVTGNLPLRALLLLEESHQGAPRLQQVTGGAAITAIVQNVFRPEYARCLEYGTNSFRHAAVVAQSVPVFRLVRQRDFAHVEQVVHLLETQFG